jgi:hypothetical protein
LNPSVSACWLTLASVAITWPFAATACIAGINWLSMNGYEDQHCRTLAGSRASA